LYLPTTYIVHLESTQIAHSEQCGKFKKPENKLFGTINESAFLTYTVYN